MTIRASIGKKLALGFMLASIAPLVIGFVAYHHTKTVVANDFWVDHTHQVLQQLETLISALKDVETGQRGYLITGDEHYLEPYLAAVKTVDQTFTTIKQMTADNAD
jgi:CHASE3 domain sensor protein